MNTTIKTDDRIKRLVKVIGNETLPRRELVAALGLRQNSRRNFRENYMKPAFARGYIMMQFPGSPSCPEQAYKLTATGLEYLEEIRSEEKKTEKE